MALGLQAPSPRCVAEIRSRSGGRPMPLTRERVMNRREILATAGAVGALSLAGCKPTAAGGGDLAARKYGTWGFDPAGMDKSVAPGDDFFRYSAGKAFDALKIPAD